MSKATTPQSDTAVAVQHTEVAPTKAAVGRGFEHVSIEQITMPRGKLLQSNSPEVSDRDYNLRAGDVVHTLLMDKLPAKFIPLSIWDSNILFVPRDEPKKASMKASLNLSDEDMQGMVICRASDGKTGERYGACSECRLNEFDGNEKPMCNKTINVLAAPVEEDGTITMPVVLQFSATSYKHGKKFRDTAFYSSIGGDLFGRIYKLDSVSASGNGNTWFELKVKPAGMVSPDLLAQAEAMYESFAGKLIVVDDEDDSATPEINY